MAELAASVSWKLLGGQRWQLGDLDIEVHGSCVCVKNIKWDGRLEVGFAFYPLLFLDKYRGFCLF